MTGVSPAKNPKTCPPSAASSLISTLVLWMRLPKLPLAPFTSACASTDSIKHLTFIYPPRVDQDRGQKSNERDWEYIKEHAETHVSSMF